MGRRDHRGPCFNLRWPNRRRSRFPPVMSMNARGDGSAQSETRVQEANAAFAVKLSKAIPGSVLIACSPTSLRALGPSAVSIRNGAQIVGGKKVAIVVSPSAEDQWDAATKLGAECVVVVNGLLNNGLLPHAYFYKTMTARSAVTGAVIRRYPGPYELFDLGGKRVPLDIKLIKQGRRSLPDTREAQASLQ